MADSKQYLRLVFDGEVFLLPSTAGFTIEQRENLQLSGAGRVAAWRVTRNGRWPAYALSRDLKVVRRDDWQRAVFVEAAPYAIGIIVDDVHLMPRADTPATPFTVLGNPPTSAGHLFSAAWIVDDKVTLVLEPRAFVSYLQGLGE